MAMERSPECRLAASREGEIVTITLTQVGGGRNVILSKDSFTVDKSLHKETIMDDFYFQLGDGELSKFNIANSSGFLEGLQTLFDEIDLRE